MNTPQPAFPQKNDAWVWVLVILVVLCLCCILVGITVGGYFLIKQEGVNFPLPMLQTLLPPSPALPTAVAPSAPGSIDVQPYAPNSNQAGTLQELSPGWQPSGAPGTQTWQVTLTSSEAAVIYVGWCTTDQTHLDQNYQHLTWTVEVDGKTLLLSSRYEDDSSDVQQACRSYAGIVNSWPAGQHTIRTNMHVDQEINDGWNSYPAGDYVDVYRITVTR